MSSQNGIGLYITSGMTGNFVAKNTFTGDTLVTNSIPAGNSVAPIITNPGANSFGTAGPWSNFSF